jgi:hypothetical protein
LCVACQPISHLRQRLVLFRKPQLIHNRYFWWGIAQSLSGVRDGFIMHLLVHQDEVQEVVLIVAF